MVGRNDPCPCGSGKKFKKCCERNQELTVEAVRSEELDRMLQSFYDEYPERKDFPALLAVIKEWKSKLEKYLLEEMIEAIAIDEFFFHTKPEIWLKYVEKQQKKAVRPSVVNVLEHWKTPAVLLGEVVEVGQEFMKVKDILTTETLYLKRESEKPIPVGVHVFCFMLPDISLQDNHFLAVSSLIFLPTDHREVINTFAQTNAASSKEEAAHFLQTHLIEFWELLGANGYAGGEFTDFEAGILLEVMERLEKQNRDPKQLMNIIEDYLVTNQPNARKEAAVAAGAIRFGQEHQLFEGPYWSVKEIAEWYSVSTHSLNKYYKDINEFYSKNN
ncbi:SEC-C metal-binding domain-containing protein [Paenisporosarcina quisquiliarum]|uniref:SEC-C metal-binding domain-containing protein n=1 Tax=Paenisporosarcina quisquiliarum TaxID=365346 RepID=A0A9X3LEX1_9BACL|nr:SEC-C metal-binding domain-containing protein [Paenisporosarcina quisquiliarum]MCZ8536681.1 SEC-C metal-binding domain-containing protein [Paenisporosarcina quisquiliarum]